MPRRLWKYCPKGSCALGVDAGHLSPRGIGRSPGSARGSSPASPQFLGKSQGPSAHRALDVTPALLGWLSWGRVQPLSPTGSSSERNSPCPFRHPRPARWDQAPAAPPPLRLCGGEREVICGMVVAAEYQVWPWTVGSQEPALCSLLPPTK